MKAPRLCLFLILAAAIIPAAHAPARPSGATGLAHDTLYAIPRYVSRDTFVVVGKQVTLREIIRRSVAGERGKLGGHQDMTYTMTTRTIAAWDDKTKTQDQVLRAYADKSGNTRTIALAESTTTRKRHGEDWVIDNDEDDDPPPIRVSSGGIEFSRVPFFLEEEQEYDFELLDRTLESDRVIFKIGFKPKSDFKPLPSGIVYVDTKHYRIVHEEFRFDKNPFPLFIKGIKRISRHWTVLDGGECVFNKLMLEAEMRSDPFGFMPRNVSIAIVRDDFRFDEGYDERLFGKLGGSPPPSAATTTTAADDDETTEPEQLGELVGRLQKDDEAFYPKPLLRIDTVFRGQVISYHDSLGLSGYEKYMDRRSPLIQPRLGIATMLFDYNRAEGLVSGLSAELATRRRDDGPRIHVEGARATGSRKYRHYEELSVPMGDGKWRTELTTSYTDRVVPYGSNRPVGNWVRMLIGGEDKQDYLRWEGGRAGVSLRRETGLRIAAGYEIGQIHSVEGTTDFSFYGELRRFNAPIDEGNERAATARLAWQPPEGAHLLATVEQRLAGGALGGDFHYARTDGRLGWRRYLIGRHEVVADLRFATTDGRPPAQQLADVGGLGTVRGYPRRTLVGASSFAGRFEYLFPYDLLGGMHVPFVSSMGLQLVPWFDAGRVWDGNSEDWIHSAGIGLQLFLGAFGKASNLRVDLSFPATDAAPDDFRIDVHFAPTDL